MSIIYIVQIYMEPIDFAIYYVYIDKYITVLAWCIYKIYKARKELDFHSLQ